MILRYADELRKPETYFDKIDAKREADEGYTVLRDALAKTKKIAIGQLCS